LLENFYFCYSYKLKIMSINGEIMPLKMFDEKKPIHALSRVKNVIAVAAGKGGVGKSSVAVNLAMALKRLGRTVGIMDTDIYGPSVRRMLPEDRLPEQKGDILQPALSQGIRVMSMAYFRKDNEAAVIRAPIANGLISQFINNTDWGDLDDLIIDFPPGTGDIQLTLCQQAHITAALMVTTPQQVAVSDVRKAMELFTKVHVPVVGVVENMSYYFHERSGEKIYLFGRGGGKALAEEAGVQLLGSLPIDPDFSHFCDMGISILSQKPESPLSKEFLHLAERVLDHVEVMKGENGKHMENFELLWEDSSHAS
jgi:ATP-binding protein involved in chromosome partitioning